MLLCFEAAFCGVCLVSRAVMRSQGYVHHHLVWKLVDRGTDSQNVGLSLPRGAIPSAIRAGQSLKHVGIPWQFPCDMTIPGVPRLYYLYSCQSFPNQIPVLLSEQTCRRNSLDRNLSYWCLWLKIGPDVDVFYIPRSSKESKVVQRFKAGSVFLGLLLVPCSALHCQRLSVDKTVLSSHVNFNGQKAKWEQPWTSAQISPVGNSLVTSCDICICRNCWKSMSLLPKQLLFCFILSIFLYLFIVQLWRV